MDVSKKERLATIPCQTRGMIAWRKLLTCIHVRENTLVYNLFQVTQVRVWTLLDLGTQNNKIRQVLVKSNRDTMLRVIDQRIGGNTTAQG
jgi:hypothetical protein